MLNTLKALVSIDLLMFLMFKDSKG